LSIELTNIHLDNEFGGRERLDPAMTQRFEHFEAKILSALENGLNKLAAGPSNMRQSSPPTQNQAHEYPSTQQGGTQQVPPYRGRIRERKLSDFPIRRKQESVELQVIVASHIVGHNTHRVQMAIGECSPTYQSTRKGQSPGHVLSYLTGSKALGK